MTHFNIRRYVHYPSEQMFSLVADVERYPEFVPMCEVLTVHSSSTSTKDDKTVLIADMTVSYGLIRETFTTLIRLQPCKKRIDVQYIDSQGPFKYLENSWSFWPVKDENACEVEFFINYEFRNAIFSVMMGKIFDFASRTLVDAFERRAGEISNLI